ncbi:unnamed protein product [Nezara viridula]|uniref:Uncharacterized protein n=1 Tax=Nezara viridula TaxID=85310 RepID=A0A9P0MTL3_NEZVI|nr:unnamed protein product [Nezara viridula]
MDENGQINERQMDASNQRPTEYHETSPPLPPSPPPLLLLYEMHFRLSFRSQAGLSQPQYVSDDTMEDDSRRTQRPRRSLWHMDNGRPLGGKVLSKQPIVMAVETTLYSILASLLIISEG